MGSSSKKKGGGSDKYSPEYREKRIKNNVAVKRSRDKSKAKAQEAQSRVQQLQMENDHLQNTVDAMTSELRYLKEMLISQAGTTEYLSADTAADLEDLLHEEAPTDLAKLTTVLNEMKRIQTLQQNKASLESSQGTGYGAGIYQQQQQGQLYQTNGNLFDPNGSHYHM